MSIVKRVPAEMPAALEGYDAVNRYWDGIHKSYAAKILPGQYYVSKNDELIATVLGSCISACIYDPVAKIGGMNHFMLPEHATGADDMWRDTVINSRTRYGNFAMEHLINDIIKFGGSRGNLEVKICGGGRVMEKMTDVGLRNIAFVYDYLATEHLRLLKEDVGDIYPRKVLFHPTTGVLKVRKLKKLANNTIVGRDLDYMDQLDQNNVSGTVDLF